MRDYHKQEARKTTLQTSLRSGHTATAKAVWKWSALQSNFRMLARDSAHMRAIASALS